MPDSNRSEVRYVDATVHETAKILVVGSFAVGKTTLVGSVSEIAPLRTEEVMTAASVGVDDLDGTPEKTTTTVAMDFGRRTIGEIALYLFGMPGQRRFWDLWQGLTIGAVGALVLVDPRKVEASFQVLDQLEDHGRLPIAIAVNRFPGSPHYTGAQLRAALDLPVDTPVLHCDARDEQSSIQALIALVTHALETKKAHA